MKKINNTNKVLIIVAVVLFVLLLAVGAFAGYYFVNQNEASAEDIISKEIDSENFKALSKEEQINKASQVLEQCIKDHKINDDIEYDADNETFSFTFENGYLGGVCLKEFS